MYEFAILKAKFKVNIALSVAILFLKIQLTDATAGASPAKVKAKNDISSVVARVMAKKHSPFLIPEMLYLLGMSGFLCTTNRKLGPALQDLTPLS